MMDCDIAAGGRGRKSNMQHLPKPYILIIAQHDTTIRNKLGMSLPAGALHWNGCAVQLCMCRGAITAA